MKQNEGGKSKVDEKSKCIKELREFDTLLGVLARSPDFHRDKNGSPEIDRYPYKAFMEAVRGELSLKETKEILSETLTTYYGLIDEADDYPGDEDDGKRADKKDGLK